MKLLASPASPYARKVRILLVEKRIECAVEMLDVQPAESAVVAHNPLGKVPTLLLDDGEALFDSRVIVGFLDNVSPINRLIPENHRERTAVRHWEALADGVADAGALLRGETLRAANEQSPAFMSRQRGKVERGLELLETRLGDRHWCHADRYSLADIALGCCLEWLEFRKPGGVNWRPQFPNLARHLDRLSERPAFAETVPK